jgi:hypothetical protein
MSIHRHIGLGLVEEGLRFVEPAQTGMDLAIEELGLGPLHGVQHVHLSQLNAFTSWRGSPPRVGSASTLELAGSCRHGRASLTLLSRHG